MNTKTKDRARFVLGVAICFAVAAVAGVAIVSAVVVIVIKKRKK